MKNKDNYVDVQYHVLICTACKRLIRCFDIDVHCIISNTKCKRDTTNSLYCTFVSKAWLESKKSGQLGWNRKIPLKADIRSQSVPKEIEGNVTNKPRVKVKKYIRSPNEKIIHSCSIWKSRDI